jgi:hypothetical protein
MLREGPRGRTSCRHRRQQPLKAYEMRRERRFKAPISSGELIGGGLRPASCQLWMIKVVGSKIPPSHRQASLTFARSHGLIALICGKPLSFVAVEDFNVIFGVCGWRLYGRVQGF